MTDNQIMRTVPHQAIFTRIWRGVARGGI